MILKKSLLPTITLAKEQIHNHISQTKNHSFFPNQKKIIKFQSPIHFRIVKSNTQAKTTVATDNIVKSNQSNSVSISNTWNKILMVTTFLNQRDQQFQI